MQVPRMPSILHPTKLQSTPSVAMRERATNTIPSRQVRNTTTTNAGAATDHQQLLAVPRPPSPVMR